MTQKSSVEFVKEVSKIDGIDGLLVVETLLQ